MPKYHPLLQQIPKPEQDLCVYGLFDPDANELRYVGQTSRGITRLKEHYKDCEKKSRIYGKFNHVKNWCRKLKHEGKIFQVTYFEYTDNKENLDEMEIFYYEYFKSIGCKLINHCHPGRKYKSEHGKLDVSTATKIAMAHPDVKKKLRDSHLGQKTWMKGKKHTRKSLELISKNNYTTRYIIDENKNVYAGAKACAQFLNMSMTTVYAYLQNRIPSAKGHHFQYIEKSKVDMDTVIRRKY